MFDSLYIVDSWHFRLYLFSHKDFTISLFHPAFNPSVPYFAIPLHVTHSAPPPPFTAPAALLASPAQVVPDLPLSSDNDPSEATNSPSSSLGPYADYIPARPDMANGFLTE